MNIYNDKNDIYFLDKYSNFKYGEVLRSTVKLSKIEKLNNPYEFNYKNYLNSKNVVGTLNTYGNIDLQNKFCGNIIIYKINKLKEIVNIKLKKNLEEKELNFYKSLIFSDDINLDKSIKENFDTLNATFMLTTSGTHVVYLCMALDFIFKEKNKKSNMIKCIILILFMLFTGANIPVIRAVISYIIKVILDFFNKKISTLKNLLVTIAIMLVYNPYYILNTSFILSITCILSIILLSNLINSYLKQKLYLKIFPKFIYKKNHPFSKFLDYIILAFSINFSVFIGTLPIQISFFHKYNLLSLIFNIVLNFILSFEYFIGFLTLVLIFIPYISDILIVSNYFLLNIIIKFTSILSNFTLDISIPCFNIFQLILYYLVIFIILYEIHFLKKKIKCQRVRIKKVLNILISLFITLIVITKIYEIYFENYIYYFNVGQGNMALIRQDRKIILVDAGSTSKNVASNVLNNFLKSRAIKNIDLILITHFHSDHVNGVYNIDDKIKVGNVCYLTPDKSFNVEEEYQNVQKYLDKKGVSKIQVKYKNIKITALTPNENDIINSSDIANSNSCIYLINVKNKNYLFMGDATLESEKYFLEKINNITDSKTKQNLIQSLKNIEVIQIGHHGSSTSTSEEFLEYINAKYAVISSKKKVYGHPASTTLEKLEKYNIKYFITEQKGAIKF